MENNNPNNQNDPSGCVGDIIGKGCGLIAFAIIGILLVMFL